MGHSKQTISLLFVLFLATQIDGIRQKRMYALCPPHFMRIGNECYFISQDRANWLDAHFECRDRNSRLAEPFKQDDRFLRKYLNRLPGIRPSDLWIGARFNWERNKWQWGFNGKDLTYQSFSQMSAHNKDLKFHCAILKPELKYRWSASSCELQHRYICQHRMPYVNEKNRQRIYNKWNETYPNEMANEIEIVLSEDDLLRRRRKMQRSHLRTHANNRQIKHEYHHPQRNDISFNDFTQSNRLQHPHPHPNPNRRTRMGAGRHRNHMWNKQFDLKRNRAGGIRQRIHFSNDTNSTRGRQLNRFNHRGWRQRPKLKIPSVSTTQNYPILWPITTSSTTWPSTVVPTTMAATTVVPAILTSNDVNHYDEQMSQFDSERKREELESLRRIDEQRRLVEQRKLKEQRLLEEQRFLEERRRLEEQQRLKEQRLQEEQQRLKEQRLQEEQQRLKEQRLEEEQRLLEERRILEEQRILEEKQRLDEQRLLEEKQRLEQQRLEEQRLLQEKQRLEEQRLREKNERLEEQRRFEEQRRLKEQRQLEEQQRLLHEQRERELLEKRRQEEQQQQYERPDTQTHRPEVENETSNRLSNENERNQDELARQRAEQASNQRAIQTNEILDNISTTMSPIEKKKLKAKRLRERLAKLSDEERHKFFQRRAERNKKRGISATELTE